MKQKNVTNQSSQKSLAVENQSELRKKMLAVTFAQIDKQYGNGAVMLLGEQPHQPIEVISTGSLLIDHAIGVGGFPCGRIVEVYGPESSGKTTLALHVIAQAQKNGGMCAFIDAEHALDPVHVQKLGVDTDSLIISQPDYGEQALDIAEMLVRSGVVDLIVIDSVAALVPKAELEGDMGDAHVGLQARLMSQALRKLTPVVHKSKTVLVFINQVRNTIGGMPNAPKETTTGGKALKFYASLRIEVRRIASLKRKDVAVGNRISIKIAKNKVAPPFKKVEVDLLFDQGISPELDLLDAAIAYGVITQSGSWFAISDGTKIAQGREQVIEYLKEHSDVMVQLSKQVRAAMAMPGNKSLIVASEDEEQGTGSGE